MVRYRFVTLPVLAGLAGADALLASGMESVRLAVGLMAESMVARCVFADWRVCRRRGDAEGDDPDGRVEQEARALYRTQTMEDGGCGRSKEALGGGWR